MATEKKIDSNVTGLRIAEEESLGVLPSTPDWIPKEPNGYSEFGGQITTVARSPINPSRQRKKGVAVDLDASAGYGTDLTQENMQKDLQGFFFADLRTKAELSVAIVEGTLEEFQPTAGGDAYSASDLLFAKNFTDPGANGLHTVSGVPAAASVPVTADLPDLTGEAGTISRVGFEFASADAAIDDTGSFPALTATIKDLTTLGLIVGEWVFIGGDAAGNQFDTAASNGFARVRKIAAGRIDFDKTQGTMVTDAGAGKTIHIFFGRVLKNELGALIKRRSYQGERTLGAVDNALPSEIQAEYIVGMVANELSLNIPSADKLTVDLSYLGIDNEQLTGAAGVKTGNRPGIVEADAFNTSSDFSRIKLAVVDDTNAAPVPLFAFGTDFAVTINNGAEALKAVGVFGGFDISVGNFEVGGSITAYFADIAAVAAVRNNSDITLDMQIVKNNQGITIDFPLLSLGDGRLSVEQDQAIKLPLTTEAASGSKIDANLDYTALMVFWDYLPDLADL